MIFKPAARYPADPRAVFILALSVFTGITAIALDAAPKSLDAILSDWVIVTWGILLTLGSAITLVGMIRQTVGGIVIEQIGCVMVAATTIFYSTLAFIEIGVDALQNVGIILAWGLSCAVRWVQLQMLINNAASRAEKLMFLAQVEEDADTQRAKELQREMSNYPPDYIDRSIF